MLDHIHKFIVEKKFGATIVPECSFCKQDKKLSNSHIIPRFSVKKLGTKIRSSDHPKLPVQDTFKHPMLCKNCESYFNTNWEQPFHQNFFKPFLTNPNKRLSYGSWMLKFATSLSWRIAVHTDLISPIDLENSMKAKLDEAISTWWRFLQDELDNPGSFEQHFFPLKQAIKPVNISELSHRFIMEPQGKGVYITENEALVQAKLGDLLFIGIIQTKSWPNQRKSRLSAKSGYIKTGRYDLPPLIQATLKNAIDDALDIINTLSEE